MILPILYREELKEYDFGPGHPFRGDRYQIFPQFLRENLPGKGLFKFLEADWAEEKDLLLICQKEYIEFTTYYFKMANLGMDYNSRFFQFHTGDNRPVGRPGKVEEAARLVVGQAKKACDLIATNQYSKVVSLGGGLHHAKPKRGEGFCIYNDVAFAAKYLQKNYKWEKILILDTDAHAGNGTAEYFYEDPQVLFLDIHQDPRTLYPGTGFIHQLGEKEGRGYTINMPMPPGADDQCYALVLEEIIKPVVFDFQPQVIIRNGGSDPHFSDQLTNLALTINGFSLIGRTVREMAENVCKGRVIDMIGSGYNKEVLPYAWLALLTGLGDLPWPLAETWPLTSKYHKNGPLKYTKEMIKELKFLLREFWPSLRQ